MPWSQNYSGAISGAELYEVLGMLFKKKGSTVTDVRASQYGVNRLRRLG